MRSVSGEHRQCRHQEHLSESPVVIAHKEFEQPWQLVGQPWRIPFLRQRLHRLVVRLGFLCRQLLRLCIDFTQRDGHVTFVGSVVGIEIIYQLLALLFVAV